MQTAMIRIYGDVSCRNLEVESSLSRTEAMEQILVGFRAAMEIETATHKTDVLWNRGRWLRWAGYDPYEVAAPLGEQHLTRVQLYPAIGSHRFEYVFPGGLSTVECDDLCLNVIGEDEDTDQKQEMLVTSTLASVLHADGVSLEDHVVDFARGRATQVDEPFPFEHDGQHLIVWQPVGIVPAGLPTTLSAAVRDRGWQTAVEWLRDTQAMLEQHLDDIRMELAVWVPASAPRLSGEPLFLRCPPGQGYQRLALGAEAAAYAGSSVELAVSAAARGDWLPEREAARMAGMSKYQFRRWIETHRRRVRIGRPIASDGQPAKNRRLIHRDDLRRALRLACRKDKGEDICNPQKCWMSCLKAKECPRRERPKPVP